MADKDWKKTERSCSTRRQVLKGTVAGALALGTPTTGLVSADQKNDQLYITGNEDQTNTNYQEEEYYYSISYNDWYRIESTVQCIGGYEKAGGKWGTTFRNSSYGVARRYDPDTETPKEGQKVDVLSEQYLSFADADDGTESTFGYKYGDGYLGGWPHPQLTKLEAAETIIEDLCKVAMSSLSSAANLLLTASEMYQNLSQEYDDQNSDTSGENKSFHWTYGSGWTSDRHSDVAHYNEIDYEQTYGTVSKFYIESGMYDGTINPCVNWEVRVESPDSNLQTTSPSKTMIENWGLRKLPVERVREAGIDVQNPAVVDGDKMWFATRPKVSIRPVLPEETPF